MKWTMLSLCLFLSLLGQSWAGDPLSESVTEEVSEENRELSLAYVRTILNSADTLVNAKLVQELGSRLYHSNNAQELKEVLESLVDSYIAHTDDLLKTQRTVWLMGRIIVNIVKSGPYYPTSITQNEAAITAMAAHLYMIMSRTNQTITLRQQAAQSFLDLTAFAPEQTKIEVEKAMEYAPLVRQSQADPFKEKYQDVVTMAYFLTHDVSVSAKIPRAETIIGRLVQYLALEFNPAFENIMGRFHSVREQGVATYVSKYVLYIFHVAKNYVTASFKSYTARWSTEAAPAGTSIYYNNELLFLTNYKSFASAQDPLLMERERAELNDRVEGKVVEKAPSSFTLEMMRLFYWELPKMELKSDITVMRYKEATRRAESIRPRLGHR